MKGAATQNGNNSLSPLPNGDSNHKADTDDADEEEQSLLRELDQLQEESKMLKKKQLRDKIELLRNENQQLRVQIETEEAANDKPSSSTNGEGNKITIAPIRQEMRSQSFIFTSSNGGTLYIKPLDISPSDLEKMSLDGIIDSIGKMDSTYGYSLGGLGKPLHLSNLYNREKHTQTNGSQTPPQYEYLQPYHLPPSPIIPKNKKPPGTFSTLNKCGSFTSQEDFEARRFVQEFKARRVAHKLTQSDIGERLNRCTGARYGQSYISRLESMQLSTAIVLRMKPLLNRLLDETESGMFAEGMEAMELYHPPSRKKSKSGGSKPRKPGKKESSAALPNYRQEIDESHKLPYQRSASVPASNQGCWSSYVPHHHTLGTQPYTEQTNNFFVSGVLSSLNPGVMTTCSPPAPCKVSDPMEVALSHPATHAASHPATQLYNPYKHDVLELSPVQPRPSPEPLLHHPSPEPLLHHPSFTPDLHELTPAVKREPDITTLQPPLKPC